MDGSETKRAGDNRYRIAVVFIVQRSRIWLGSEREDRMLHAGHVIFEVGYRLKNITFKEIRD